jgi:uncharacterized protein (TIGR03437 family)
MFGLWTIFSKSAAARGAIVKFRADWWESSVALYRIGWESTLKPGLRLLSYLFAGAIAAMAQSNPPVIGAGGIVNTAGSPTVPAVAPGSLVSIFGTNLASSMASSDTVPLSATVNSVSVTFNNTPAPVQFVSSGQVNVEAPWGLQTSDLQGGPAQVVVTTNGVASAAASIQVLKSAPALFTLGGQAIAINPDGSLAAPAGSFPGIATRPAKIGDSNGLIILATGLGSVDAAIGDGANSVDQTRNTLVKPTVLIGGVAAQLVFSGLSPQFPGINQLNVVISSGTPVGNAVTLQLQIDGTVSSNTATIAVSQ